jgi:hypothetical protein
MANIQQIIVKQTGAEKTSKQIGKVDKSITGLASSALAYAAAAGAVLAVLKKTIDAYGIQEQAEKRLEVALGRNIDSLKKQASALQQLTTFGDEAILGVQASIAAFTDNEEAIKLATKATLDMAAATGMDLKAAGDLVAKSLGSSTNALSRYGIEVTGAVGSTERLDTLVGNIADKFEGQAAAAADTMAGQMTQAKNAMGDAAEVIGQALSPAIITLAQGLKRGTELLFGMNTELDQLIAKSTAVTTLTRDQAKANKEWYELQLRMIDSSKELGDARTVMRDIGIETNLQLADSIPLLKQQDAIVNDLRTNWQKWGDANEENIDSMAKGIAMSGNVAEASRALANQYIVEGVFGAVKSALVGVPFPLNILAAGAAGVAANQLFNTIVPSRKAASGADFVTNGQELVLVGDNSTGREHVSVTPLGGESGGSGVTINIQGDFIGNQDFVESTLIPAINLAQNQGRASIA